MKKIFTTLFTLLIAGIFVSLYAQQVPNNGFENWTGGKPTSWDCANVTGIVTTVTEETGAPYSGSKSVKIETKTSLVGTIPGFITLGTFDLATQSINGGIQFPFRPTKLKGFYKYTPGMGDQAFFGVGISKWMGTTRDTIGEGLLLAPMPVSTWSPFEVEITWSSTDTPDSLNIIIAASDLVGGGYVVGSTLWVDELSFEYTPVGFDENDFTSLAVQNYPNPFSKTTLIDFVSPINTIYEFSVYNLIGVEVFKTNIDAQEGLNSYTFSGNDLPAGMYMYNMKSGNISQTKTMLISR
ncbi:MAG: PCMD domain-containing protein [Bacteroidales bacterium]|nr:PCMD domain-containing protein [Bacteroidales bacterium]